MNTNIHSSCESNTARSDSAANESQTQQHIGYVRLPKPKGKCPITGLSRTGLNDLIESSQGKIRFINLRKKYAQRGVKLINKQSLLEYLQSVETVITSPHDQFDTAEEFK